MIREKGREAMGLMRFNYRSQVLGHYMDISIACPTDGISYYEEADERRASENPVMQKNRATYRPGMKFQTVYLIHGGGDDDTLTFRYTNVERYAQENQVMVVVPGIPNSFGVDALYGVKYMTFLTDELPVVIQSLFPSSPKREDNFVMGYAMGGNVALGMAVMHPELYRTCVDLSGGIGMTLCTQTLVDELNGDHFRTFMPLYNASFGEGNDFPGSPLDLYPIAKRYKEEGRELCDFYILCGEKEFIRSRVEDDVRILKKLGYPVQYFCPEGYDHNFENWDQFIRVAFEEWLPLKRRIL